MHVRMYIYHAVAVAIVEADPTQNVGALEQETKRGVQPEIEWFLP